MGRRLCRRPFLAGCARRRRVKAPLLTRFGKATARSTSKPWLPNAPSPRQWNPATLAILRCLFSTSTGHSLLYRRWYYIILTKQRRVSGQEGTTIHFEKVLHKPSSMDISGYLSCMHFCDLCNKHNYLCCRISWLVTRVFYLIPVLINLSMFKLLNRYLIF